MKTYISHQKARKFGALAYRLAKLGKHMLVTHHGQNYWLGYVTPHGYYLKSYAVAA